MNHKRWVPRWVTVSYACASLIAFAFILFCQNSYSFLLWRSGFENASLVDSGIDVNGKEYRVLYSRDWDGNVELAYCTKGFAGIWGLERTSDTFKYKPEMMYMHWLQLQGGVAYGSAPMELEYENHIAYAGNNALKKIEIPRIWSCCLQTRR